MVTPLADEERRAAKGDEAAERDNEGWNLAISNEEPLKQPIAAPSAMAKTTAMIQMEGWPKPSSAPFENLQHAGCYGDNAEHRTNRKINLAQDDNQHHAGGHHRDG